MADKLLILVNTNALHEAIAAKIAGFEVYWSFERQGREKTDETARREIAGIAELHPALIVIELDQPAGWLPRVRSDPATRRIPVIAIADDTNARARAADAGIQTIFTGQAFIDALPGVIQDHLKTTNVGAIHDQCDNAPSPLVLKGLHEFNTREYYECHETLEAAWNKESGPLRELYRAILQVGIAYYQIERGNFWGAHKMFLRTIQWFAPLPDFCQGINVAQLKADAAAAQAHLETLGPERINEFDRSLLKPVIYEGAPT